MWGYVVAKLVKIRFSTKLWRAGTFLITEKLFTFSVARVIAQGLVAFFY